MKHATLLAALLLAGCAAPSPDPEPETTSSTSIRELHAERIGNVVHLTFLAPSGGFSFELLDVEADDGGSDVRVVLTRPAPDSAVTLAFVTHKLEVELPSAGGPARILVQQLVRGRLYEVAPKFELAMTVEP